MTRDPGPVVGAGMAGVATAFALSRRGVREIVIVEAFPRRFTSVLNQAGCW